MHARKCRGNRGEIALSSSTQKWGGDHDNFVICFVICFVACFLLYVSLYVLLYVLLCVFCYQRVGLLLPER